MPERNLSPNKMFADMARAHRPEYAFKEKGKADVSAWKRAALPKVLATLGDFPKTVPPRPELVAEWEEGELVCQRWIIDVQKGLSAVLLVNKPKGLAKREKRPAILCCHGHGAGGKEPVMGNATSPVLRDAIKEHNYNYGQVMAELGYVTYAIDWIGFGERDDNGPRACAPNVYGRDWCNLYYLHATMFGMTSLSINVSHGKTATDVVCKMPNVDPERLGVMGLSGGGTMSLWMSLCDERFKATEIICYSDLWEVFGMQDINYCGMQVAPGLYKLVDLPDLQGLLVPRPLLIDIGTRDGCFNVDSAMACYKRLEKIYRAADAAEKLELDLHPGEHGWGANKAPSFFEKHLGGQQPVEELTGCLNEPPMFRADGLQAE